MDCKEPREGGKVIAIFSPVSLSYAELALLALAQLPVDTRRLSPPRSVGLRGERSKVLLVFGPQSSSSLDNSLAGAAASLGTTDDQGADTRLTLAGAAASLPTIDDSTAEIMLALLGLRCPSARVKLLIVEPRLEVCQSTCKLLLPGDKAPQLSED